MNHFDKPQMSPEPMTTNPHTETKVPLTVAEIMTTNLVTVGLRESLAHAIALLSIHRFHHLLVTDPIGKLVGVLSDRDLLGAVARITNWQTCEISQIMTANPVTVRPECPLSVAVSMMLSKRFNSLPVLDEKGMVTGILTSTDLLRSYESKVESLQMRLQQIGLVEFSLADR